MHTYVRFLATRALILPAHISTRQAMVRLMYAPPQLELTDAGVSLLEPALLPREYILFALKFLDALRWIFICKYI